MLRRFGLARRSAQEWAMRGGLALGIALLGYCSLIQTIAWTERTSASERAYALQPGDGRIAALLAQKLSGADADAKSRARADRLARAALLREPTAVAAVTTLGIDASLGGDQARAERLFAYAGKLSRRDLRTQLWLIEDATSRNDIPGALHYYDIALRSSDGTSEFLFPVLASAVVEPAIRGSLIGTLAKRPPWTQSFVEYLAPSGVDPSAIADFLYGLRHAGVPVSHHADAVVINALLDRNLLEKAWRYYTAVRPGSDRRSSRDSHFMAELDYPSAFDWTLADTLGMSASMQRIDASAGVLDFAIPAGMGGVLVRQMEFLPPGDYVLEGHGTGIDQPPVSIPYWSLSCVGGQELGRVASAANGRGSFFGRFTVPAGCAVQYLSFVARLSDKISGLHGRVDWVQLRPAPGAARGLR